MTITTIIIILTCIISYYGLQNPVFFHRFKHYPYDEVRHNSLYRMITSGFLHGSFMHLLVNMFVLYFFGLQVEQYFSSYFGVTLGGAMYVIVYILMIIGGDIPSYFKQKNNSTYASIGASGAVSGILAISAILAPWNYVYLYGLIPLPAIVAVVGYIGYSHWASKNSQDQIDHDAHFYGALCGILLAFITNPSLMIHFWKSLTNGVL